MDLLNDVVFASAKEESSWCVGPAVGMKKGVLVLSMKRTRKEGRASTLTRILNLNRALDWSRKQVIERKWVFLGFRR